MPPSKDGMIDMAPPSVLGSDARSASLANIRLRIADRDVSGACGRSGDGGTRRCGAPFHPTAARLGRASAGLAWSGVHRRGCVLPARSRQVPESARARGQIGRGGGAAMGAPGTWAVKARPQRQAPRAGSRPGPRSLARHDLEQRVRDRGDPGGIWRLALDAAARSRSPPSGKTRPTRWGRVTGRDPGSSGMTILARA